MPSLRPTTLLFPSWLISYPTTPQILFETLSTIEEDFSLFLKTSSFSLTVTMSLIESANVRKKHWRPITKNIFSKPYSPGHKDAEATSQERPFSCLPNRQRSDGYPGLIDEIFKLNGVDDADEVYPYEGTDP